MAKKKDFDNERVERGIGGVFGGLGDLFEKLSDLAEHGEELSREGEVRMGTEGTDSRGIFGFSVKVGLGGKGVKLEPFGNIGRDKETGKSVVHEVREPLVDLFEEEDHLLIVAEMPGIEAADVKLDLTDDILTITAAKGEKKYRKEVLLPAVFATNGMKVSCNHGIVEIKCGRPKK